MTEDRVEIMADSLGISPVPESVESLRKEIRAEISALHPDRNEGEFVDEESRERFLELSNALVVLDSNNVGSALVPLSTVAPMVSAIMDALGQGGRGEAAVASASVATQRQAVREEAREEARHRFRLSRYGSGAIATVVTVLGSLPTLAAAAGSGSLSAALDASFIAPVFAYPLFEPVTFAIAVYAWLFFGLTWFMEQNDLERIDWITTDEFRGRLVHSAVLGARQRGDVDGVTKADLRSALDRRLRPAFILRLLGARDVSPSFLDRVVTLHVDELIAQGVLAPADGPALSPRYQLDEGVAESIQP